MTDAVHMDFETASATDLTKSGVYRYAECPTTRIWCMSWSMGHGPVSRWYPPRFNMEYPGLVSDNPGPLLNHIAAGGLMVNHNAGFERRMWRWAREVGGCPHWPELKIEQQRCTLARAAAMALPQGLDELGVVLGLAERKDREGSLLMKRMAKPRSVYNNQYTWWDSEENLERLGSYCDQDVRAERDADEFLPQLSPYELELWFLDQRINDRGVYVDEGSVNRAVDVVLEAKRRADGLMRELTGGVVKKCTEGAKLAAWINARGINCTTVKKGVQDDLIFIATVSGDELVKKVIELRRASMKTSTSKYAAMLRCICDDGGLRGLLAYHGARPGRWAGRLVQPQNFPRVDADVDATLVEFVTAMLSIAQSITDTCDAIEMVGFNVMDGLSKSLRGMIKAHEGNKLVGGDFSNIEGRINAWCANETWKLEAFAAYDWIMGDDAEGKPIRAGDDLYYIGASGLTGKTIAQITKFERQSLGKIPELALGYQGGVNAFITMGDTYNVKTWDLIAPVRATTDAALWDKVAKTYGRAHDKCDLPVEDWTAVKLIVQKWRAKQPNIVQSWWDLNDAAVEAVLQPGTPVSVYDGKCSYLCIGEWLYCQLPSKRVIVYCQPSVRQTTELMVKIGDVWTPHEQLGLGFIDTYGIDIWEQDLKKIKAELEYYGFECWIKSKRTVWFWGIDSKTRQWTERYLYGGLQCENIVQAIARCVMDHAMFRAERAGYELILTVHDELLAEVAQRFGSAEDFERIMSVRPDWIKDMPLAAVAWEDERYVK